MALEEGVQAHGAAGGKVKVFHVIFIFEYFALCITVMDPRCRMVLLHTLSLRSRT